MLHLGIGGPKVNISFMTKLKEEFSKENSEFLQVETCSLHPVHTALKTGLKKLDFPFDSLFHDLSFFFHLSSTGREDYKSLEEIKNVYWSLRKEAWSNKMAQCEASWGEGP